MTVEVGDSLERLRGNVSSEQPNAAGARDPRPTDEQLALVASLLSKARG